MLEAKGALARQNNTMKILLIICTFVIPRLIFAKEKNDKNVNCEGLHVRGKFHRKEVLTKGLNRPYQLSMYKHEPKIFFSYNVGKNEEDTFKIAYIKPDLHGHIDIDNIENGFATAVDEEKRVAYFGGSTGIYRYNLDHSTHDKNPDKNSNNTLEKISSHNIWDMFFKHELYYITYPSQRLYKYNVRHSGATHEHQEHITDEIFQFAIDGANDQFLTNQTGLYMIKNGTDHRIAIKGHSIFRAIEINNKGEAHFCSKHGIYVVNKHNHTLEEIVHIKNIFGLTFDANDNIIYSDPHEIVVLIPENCK